MKTIINELKKLIAVVNSFGIYFGFKYFYSRITRNRALYLKLCTDIISPYVNVNQLSCLSNDCNSILVKFPIWIFWWQGYDEMPDLCKACYKSVHDNLPKNAEIVFISKSNYQHYVAIPSQIIDKINNGTYSITLFSDLLRNALLSKYGGLWLDSTIYCSKQIDGNLLNDNNYWSVKLVPRIQDNNAFGRYVTNRKWGGFIQKATSGERINTIVYDSLINYMSANDFLIDYFIQNIIIRFLYENDYLVKSEIDTIPFSNPNLYELDRIMSQPFNQSVWDKLIANTTFFKLSWKTPYLKEVDGNMTYYGYLLNTLNNSVN